METFTEAFSRFTGGFHPVPVIVSAVLLAIALLGWLEHNGFQARRPGLHRGLAWAAGSALGMALLMVVADTISPYAADINVPLPTALAFYPAIGFVAEVAFHLLPLAGLLLALRPAMSRLGQDGAVRVAILVTALVEPAFQTVLAVGQGYPAVHLTYMVIHIFALNVIQLWLFRRWDFVSMYAFRLVYYLAWHIVWGYLRLQLLF